MKRLPLMLLLLPALASAQERGEVAFNKACAQCHQARTPTETPKSLLGVRQPVGPYMDQVLRKKSLTEVRTWVESPHRINPKTNCDTRLLSRDELDGLTSYLSTVVVAPPPTRRMRLRRQMEEQAAALQKADAEAKAKSQPKTQGKQ
ncbi:c-type cytochrome [Corallococcus sp. AS-1-6]|uniref:c-type cytochrome n=1 Tax=Corallococcus TaxID=83461 RepID=UPI001CBF3383|nr:c-type cytochrome [Corallococcus sp. AS-1-6]MBZ4372965.1 c-type cytochrome [Corallococcus sp. AS-1-6]